MVDNTIANDIKGHADSEGSGYEVHHIKPLAEGGKDTPKNLRVIKKTKHKQIRANRKKRGKI